MLKTIFSRLFTRNLPANSLLTGDSLYKEKKSSHWPAVVALIAAALIVILFWPLRTVPTGHRGVITVGGKITGIEGEGFVLVAPWQTLNVFNVRAESAEIKDADGATSDQQPVKTSLVVRYSVMPKKVPEVFEQYSRDGNLDSYVATASMDVFKAVTARYTAPNLIAQRQMVSSDILSALRVRVAQYGARVINVDMTNFSFNPAYMAAINEKTNQDQLLQAAEKKVLTVTAQQKEKVAVAEAEASAARAVADGRAYAITKQAEAEAEANALWIQNTALSQSKDVLELRRIEVEMAKAWRWNGALPQAIYAGTPIPFFTPGK